MGRGRFSILKKQVEKNGRRENIKFDQLYTPLYGSEICVSLTASLPSYPEICF